MSPSRRNSAEDGDKNNKNGESEKPSGPINPAAGKPYYTDELIEKLLPDAIRHDGTYPWPFDMEYFVELIPIPVPVTQEMFDEVSTMIPGPEKKTRATRMVPGKFQITLEHPGGILVAIAVPTSFPTVAKNRESSISLE